MAIGHGVAVDMFMYAVIGTGQDQAVSGYAARGNVARAVTGGTAAIGDNPPAP